MAKDIIFIDDSGSKFWDVPYAQEFVDQAPVRNNNNRNFWLHNYFVLAGVYIDSETIAKLNPLIHAKKQEVFGQSYVEIHSSSLRNPHQRRKQYLEKYNVSENDLTEFIDGFWYPMIENNPQMKIQAVVLDKRYHKNKRDRTPLEITVQALFDRIELGPNRTSRIVFDQMDDEVKSKKRDQGKILRIADHEINLGVFHEKYSHTSISFETSEASNFLQIADTVAYNVLRQFVDYGDKWDGIGTSDEMYPYFKRIYGNFYCKDGSDQPKGVGITKLPDPNSFRRRK
jgi:hypothetical protein